MTENSFAWQLPFATGTLGSSVVFYTSQNMVLFQRSNEVVLTGGRRYSKALPVPLLGLADKLLSLDLSHNALKHLPSEIGSLTRLVKLNLSCNELATLPPALCQLTDLQELILAHNELGELSDAVGFLQQLHKLDVSHNHLRDLPTCLGCLPHLRELPSLTLGNQLEFPAEVLEGSAKDVVGFLRHRLRTLRRPLERVPILVVGDRHSGKRALLSALERLSPSVGASKFSVGSPVLSESQKLSKSANKWLRNCKTTDDHDPLVNGELGASFWVSLEAVTKSPGGKANTATSPWIVDAWELSSWDLLPVFVRPSSVVLYVVSIAADSFSYGNVLRWVHFLSGASTLLVVATQAELLPPDKLQSAMFGLKRLVADFPNVKEVFCDATSNKADVKKIAEAIARATAEQVGEVHRIDFHPHLC